MEPERWQRIEALFERALALETGERGAYLSDACAGDAGLRHEVESLLAADGRADEAFRAPAADFRHLSEDLARTRLGLRCGHYTLTRWIASGGMGTVYLGERDDDNLHREAAIKVVNPGMDTEGLLRRFEAERRALAALDHPNIARFLDAGRSDDGLPYLVMEHVDGRSLDAACVELGLNARLHLFSEICAGVDYAHRKLVVHRDIKPSNILVNAEGVPKLLDFGIAKVLEPGDADPAATTGTQRFLSPEFASPEQLLGQPITTATDIYSLGVLLYQVLTDRRPYSLTGQSPAAVERLICEIEPPPPSSVVPPDGRVRAGQLAGDLDWIVARALRKEPEARYGSARELAEELRRHREGRPVLARRPTLRYRIGKFVRRNRVVVGAIAATLLATLAAAVVAVNEARHAREEARVAQQVLGYVDSLLADLDPHLGGPRVSVEGILERGGEGALHDLADAPEARALLSERIGNIYRGLGMRDKATVWLTRAVETYREELGAQHREVGDALHALGAVELAEHPVRGRRHLQDALAIRERVHGAHSGEAATTTQLIGLSHWREGAFDAARPWLDESVRLARVGFPEPEPDLVELLRTAANYYLDVGSYDQALALAHEARELGRRLGAPHDIRAATTLAGILQDTGHYEQAEPLFRERLARSLERLDASHPDVLSNRLNLALLLRDTGRTAEAEPLARQVLASLDTRPADSLPGLRGDAWTVLAKILWDERRLDEAEAACRRGVELARHPPIGAERTALLGEVLIASGRPAEAERLLREAVDVLAAALPERSWKTARARNVLGASLVGLGRLDEAERLLVESYPRIRDDRGPRHPRTREALERLVALYEARGRPDRVEHYRGLLAAGEVLPR